MLNEILAVEEAEHRCLHCMLQAVDNMAANPALRMKLFAYPGIASTTLSWLQYGQLARMALLAIGIHDEKIQMA